MKSRKASPCKLVAHSYMCGMAISTLMVVELSVVVTAALSIPSNSIFFVNIIIVKVIIFNMIIMPEQTHAASQKGQHAEKLHRPLEASPQKLSRLHLQEVSPPRLYTLACLMEHVADQVQKRRKSIWWCSLWLELPFRETSKQC